VFESYKRFTKNFPLPEPLIRNKSATVSKEPNDAITSHSKLKVHSSSIKEVDIPDREILSMAIRSWGLDPAYIGTNLYSETASTTDLGDSLSEIEWD
jgi:hypothetical protein